MSASWEANCDDFYVSNRLYLKLDMSLSRETVLHFFDVMRKEFPDMVRMRRRDDGAVLLEEDSTERASRRWIRIEPTVLRFGYFAPPNMEEVQRLSEFVLEQAPFHLTFSSIDYDHLEVVYGFDLDFIGNHDQLIAETLYRDHPLASFTHADEAVHAIDVQPYLGIALSADCDLQAYLEIKSRTATYEIRTNNYESQPLSVYLTIRKYWGYSGEEGLVDVHRSMADQADDLAANKIVPLVINPLAQAIASQP